MANALSTLFIEFRASTGKFADDMAGVSRQVREFDKILRPIKDRAADVGRTLTASLTVPLVGLGAAAIASANKIDEAMDTIRSSTGATGKALADLGVDFKAVLGSVPNSVEDVAKAIGDLNTRTGLAGKPLQDLATQILNVSRVTKTDLSANIAATTRLFGDWSVAAQDQGAALDYLFKVSQQTGIGFSQLSQTVVQFGAPLRALGFSLDQGAALLGKWEKEGVNMETVLSGMRYALGQFAKANLDPQQAMQQTIAAIKGAKNETEATGIAFKVFGQRAAVDMGRAILEGRFDVDQLVDSIKGSSETINKAAADTESFSEKLSRLQGAATKALEPLGKQMLDALEKLMPVLQGGLQIIADVATAFSKLPSGVQGTILAIAGIAAAAGPALLIFAKFSGTITGLIGLVTKFSPLLLGLIPNFASIGAAISLIAEAVGSGGLVAGFTAFASIAGPIGIAVAAVGALGAAAYALYKNWDDIKGPLSDIWTSIKDAAKDIFASIVSTFQDVKTQALAVWKDFAPTILDGFSVLGSGIKTIFDTVASVVANAFRAVGAVISGGFEIIHGLFDIFEGAITLNWSKVWDGLSLVVAGAWKGITGIVKAGVSIIVNALSDLLSFWGSVFTKLGSHIPGIGGALKEIGDAFDAASKKTSAFASDLNKSTSTVQAAGTAAKATADNVKAVGTAAASTGTALKTAGAAAGDLNKLLNPEAGKKYAEAMESIRAKVTGNTVEMKALNAVIIDFQKQGVSTDVIVKSLGKDAIDAATHWLALGKAIPEATANLALAAIKANALIDLAKTAANAEAEIEGTLAKASLAFVSSLSTDIAAAQKQLDDLTNVDIWRERGREISDAISQTASDPIKILSQPVTVPPVTGIHGVTIDATAATASVSKLKQQAIETAAKIDAMSRAGYNGAQIAKVLGGEIDSAADTVKVFGRDLDQGTIAIIKQAEAAKKSADQAKQWQQAYSQALGNIISDFVTATTDSLFAGGKFLQKIKDAGVNAGKSFVNAFLLQLTSPIEKFLTDLGSKLADKLTSLLTGGVSNGLSGILSGILGGGNKNGLPAGGILNFAGIGGGLAGLFGGGVSLSAVAAGAVPEIPLAGVGLSTGAVAAGGAGAGAGGGLGAAAAGLATNPITIAAAAALGAGLLISHFTGGARKTANQFVKQVQNPFGANLTGLVDAFNLQKSTGALTLDSAKQARDSIIQLIAQFKQTASQFAAQGGHNPRVVQQANETFTKAFGENFSKILDPIVASVKDLQQQADDAAKMASDAAKTTTDAADTVAKSAQIPATGLATSASRIFADAVTKLQDTFQVFTDAIQKFGDWIQQLLEKGLPAATADQVPSLAFGGLLKKTGLVLAHAGEIVAPLDDVRAELQKKIAAGGAFATVYKKLLADINSKFPTKEDLSATVAKIGGAMGKLAGGIKDKVSVAAQQIGSVPANMIDAAQNAAENFGPQMPMAAMALAGSDGSVNVDGVQIRIEFNVDGSNFDPSTFRRKYIPAILEAIRDNKDGFGHAVGSAILNSHRGIISKRVTRQ